ncbi:MAG TPA: hypothetical protein VIW68_12670 [Candidatus Sulfotelmatobacter sp.]
MRAIVDDSQQMELADLQSRLMSLIAQGANDGASPQDREAAKNQALDLAQRICAIKGEGDAPVFLVNLTPKRWILNRSYATYWISGKSKEEQFRSTVIAPAIASRDAGVDGEPFTVRNFGTAWKPKRGTIPYRAREVASDLYREINGDLPGLQAIEVNSEADTQGPRVSKFMGVFLSDTEVPAKEDLEANILKLRGYYAALVSEGNLIYQRTRNYSMLSTLCHRACDYLGIETEWHQNLLDRVPCPGCGASVSSRIARCPTCKWILNIEAVKEQNRLEEQIAAGAMNSSLPKGKRSPQPRV